MIEFEQKLVERNVSDFQSACCVKALVAMTQEINEILGFIAIMNDDKSCKPFMEYLWRTFDNVQLKAMSMLLLTHGENLANFGKAINEHLKRKTKPLTPEENMKALQSYHDTGKDYENDREPIIWQIYEEALAKMERKKQISIDQLEADSI